MGVVGGPGGRIRKHAVRLGDLRELGRAVRTRAIGMVFQGQSAIGAAQLGGGRGRRNAQDGVKVDGRRLHAASVACVKDDRHYPWPIAACAMVSFSYGGAMARAIWNGAISFGLVTIPVQLVSAVRSQRPRFHLLHAKDESPVHYERVCQREVEARCRGARSSRDSSTKRANTPC